MPAFYGHLRVLQQIVWKPAFWWLQERTRTPIISSWFFQENSTFSLSLPYLLPEFIIAFPIEVHWIRETCVRKSRPKRFANRAISVWTALFLFMKTHRHCFKKMCSYLRTFRVGWSWNLHSLASLGDFLQFHEWLRTNPCGILRVVSHRIFQKCRIILHSRHHLSRYPTPRNHQSPLIIFTIGVECVGEN